MAKNTKISFQNRDRYIALGLNIAYYRKREGLTQEQLAERAELSHTFLSGIEAPGMVTVMSLEVIFSLADALGVSVHKLLEFRD